MYVLPDAGMAPKAPSDGPHWKPKLASWECVANVTGGPMAALKFGVYPGVVAGSASSIEALRIGDYVCGPDLDIGGMVHGAGLEQLEEGSRGSIRIARASTAAVASSAGLGMLVSLPSDRIAVLRRQGRDLGLHEVGI